MKGLVFMFLYLQKISCVGVKLIKWLADGIAIFQVCGIVEGAAAGRGSLSITDA
jgi:hypothetical protein